jgi:hypothetical protein
MEKRDTKTRWGKKEYKKELALLLELFENKLAFFEN